MVGVYRIIPTMPSTILSLEQISEAVTILKRGGVIAFPTETVYGLGCDPRNAEAVRRIFEIKGRDWSKPLLLVAASIAQVQEVAIMNAHVEKLAEMFWPGPLTLILPLKEPTPLVSGVAVNGEVAIRISSSEVVKSLTSQFKFPIVATSANRSGEAECISAEAVRRALPDIDAVVDGGSLALGKPSTVARVDENGAIEVIRRGAIDLE